MKRLVLLTVILLVAVPVFAQGPQFQTGSANPTLRSEGLTETVGNVSLVTTSTAATIPAGSNITVTYSVPVTNASSLGLGNITANGILCTSVLPPAPAICPSSVTAAGSIVSLNFAAATNFVAGDALIISGVRVNANAAGQGTTIFANLATNPATAASFTNAGPLPVGSVFSGLSTAVTITPAVGSLLTCTPSPTAAPGEPFTISVAETFASAITSLADEILLSNTPAPTRGTRIQIDFSSLPTGVTITNTGTGGLVLVSSTTTQWVFEPNTAVVTNTGAIETYAPTFAIRWTTPLAAGAARNITATVKLAPIGGTTIIRFADVVQGSGTVATLTDCVTTLYFPFIAADVAGFDTSVAISNSSKDTDETGAAIFPATIGATAQAGTCKWVGYKTPDLSAPGTITATPVTFTTPSIAAGGTWATSLGTTAAFGGDPAVLGDGVAGYAFVTCNFLNAHGFAFITNGFGGTTTISHGYIPLVVPRNTSRVAAGGEALNN